MGAESLAGFVSNNCIIVLRLSIIELELKTDNTARSLLGS